MSGDSNAAAPAPADIRDARVRSGITQAEAADMVHTSDRNWQYWEAGRHPMPLGLWELFQLKIAQRAEAQA
ncbi:MAG TPA: helix-turn-helix domain-containing protein [Pseudoxanthomonas sp.]